MTDLPPADQPGTDFTTWSETPTTQCILCAQVFDTAADTMEHISLEHSGNRPEAFRLACVAANHGMAITDQGTVPIISLGMLLQYDSCGCGCGRGPGYQLANVHATVEQWRHLAEQLVAQTTPEAVAAAAADYVASLDAEKGPPDA